MAAKGCACSFSALGGSAAGLVGTHSVLLGSDNTHSGRWLPKTPVVLWPTEHVPPRISGAQAMAFGVEYIPRPLDPNSKPCSTLTQERGSRPSAARQCSLYWILPPSPSGCLLGSPPREILQAQTLVSGSGSEEAQRKSDPILYHPNQDSLENEKDHD